MRQHAAAAQQPKQSSQLLPWYELACVLLLRSCTFPLAVLFEGPLVTQVARNPLWTQVRQAVNASPQMQQEPLCFQSATVASQLPCQLCASQLLLHSFWALVVPEHFLLGVETHPLIQVLLSTACDWVVRMRVWHWSGKLQPCGAQAVLTRLLWRLLLLIVLVQAALTGCWHG